MVGPTIYKKSLTNKVIPLCITYSTESSSLRPIGQLDQ